MIGDAAVRRLNAVLLRRLRPWLAAGRVQHAWRSGGRVVVVAPHPDDETLGAGGVIARHVDDGDPVRVVTVTDGGASRAGGVDRPTMARTRAREMEEAMAALGVSERVPLGFPEGDWEPEAVATALGPRLADAAIIYAPSPVDYHPDHLRLARLLGPLLPSESRVRAFEVGVPLGPALVNLVADVRPVAERKAAALAAYVSQSATIRTTVRLDQYRMALHGPAAGEVFWELSATAYARLVAGAGWDWRRTPFRAVRPRAASDVLAYTVGHRARLALRALAERPP